jgi:hypothetical protein
MPSTKATRRCDSEVSSPSFQPADDPEVVFNVRVVEGEEGRELRAAQLRAMKDILIWVQTERRRRAGSGRAS